MCTGLDQQFVALAFAYNYYISKLNINKHELYKRVDKRSKTIR